MPRSGSANRLVTAGSVWSERSILREKPFPQRDSPSAAQTANRVRMQKVGAAWRSLSMSQALAWQAYGQTEAGEESAEVALPQLIFNRLAMRFLQVSPSLPIPLDPPTSAFPGDSVRVSLTVGAGSILVTALGANAPGVVTEILLQRLDSPLRRTYERKYVAAQFVAFTAGQSVTLPVRAGVWAVATRFTLDATGQSTALLEVGRVVISG